MLLVCPDMGWTGSNMVAKTVTTRGPAGVSRGVQPTDLISAGGLQDVAIEADAVACYPRATTIETT